MAKRNRQIKGRGHDFEVSEQLDDHILPSAEDIIKYKEADQSLPIFIQETARKEQEFRHEMSRNAMKLSFREQGLQHGLNYFGMTIGACVSLAILWYSYELMKMGLEVQGTIFSGVTVTYWLILFIIRKRPQGETKTN